MMFFGTEQRLRDTYRPILRILWRYMFALGLVGACVLLCLGIPKVMAPRPFLAFWPVVVVAAEFGGIGPGLFATVASILCVHFILNPVFGGLNLFDWIGMTTAGIFLAGASVISLFIGRKRNIQYLQRLQATAMQSATNGIALTDAQGVLLWANPAFCTMTGHTSGEIIGKIHWLLDGAEQNEALLENHRLNVLQREVWHGELVRRRKDGTTYVEERSVTPVSDADGRIINCVIIMQDITERKRIEEALRESEERFKTLHNASFGGIAIHDKGKILECNQGLSEMMGYSRDELLSMDGFMLIAPEYREFVKNNVAAGFEKTYEAFGLRKNGEIFPIILEARNVPYKGKTVRTVEFRDITERRQAEEVLRLKNHVFDTSIAANSIADVAGVITEINDAFLKIWGYSSKNEIIGHTISYFLNDPEDAVAIFNALRENDNWQGNFTAKKKDGSIFIAHTTATTLRDENGNVTGYQSSVMDITEHKLAENNLKQREDLLQKIFDVLPIGLWFADKDGNLLRGNPAGVKIWGAEPKAAFSEYGIFKARRLPSGEEIAPEDWALAHTIREGVTVLDEMLEIDAFDGQTKVILNYTAPVLDDRGTLQGAIVVNLDITRSRQAEEELLLKVAELEQWHNITLYREERIGELKKEVNDLLKESGRPRKYSE
jgi:PAS domain S-box-containing protein